MEMELEGSFGIEGSHDMTREQAIAIVIDIASRWGENSEEQLPRRVTAADSDDDLIAMLKGETDVDDYDLETAKECRDLWKAIDILQEKQP